MSRNGRSPVCWFKWDPFEPPSLAMESRAEKIAAGGVTPEPVTDPGQMPISFSGGDEYLDKSVSEGELYTYEISVIRRRQGVSA